MAACDALRKWVRTKRAGESMVSVTRMLEERGGMGVLSAVDGEAVGKDSSESRFGIVSDGALLLRGWRISQQEAKLLQEGRVRLRFERKR